MRAATAALRPEASESAWDSADLADVPFACPGCGTALQGLQCPSCATEFPVTDGIPWLFADPGAAQAEWRNRHDHACRRLEAERARVLEALRGAVSQSTRRRLERLAAGQGVLQTQIDAILGPVLGAGGAPLASHIALRTRLPSTQGLLTYESNVFRDWSWGAAECSAALEAVLGALGGCSPARILVLGSGAGRLAYDLHQATGAVRTVALDLNPLLTCVGARVSRGETLALTEFPISPRAPDDVAVARQLVAPSASRSGLVFVLGDALRAPFLPGSFDLVVTPWLLDVLDAPAGVLLARINRLLEPDGIWINHGSVGFAHRDPAEQLTRDELIELAGGMGFEVTATRERALPYLCCPESRHGRVEEVLTFCAERRADCAGVLEGPALPNWITDDGQAIPALPAFQTQALATRTHAYIMSLIDGQRCISDIAATLARHGLMDEAGARVALKGFLATMYAEATRGRGF